MTSVPYDPHDVFIEDFARYWSVGLEVLRALPLRRGVLPESEPLPPRITMVRLPEWAADLGVDGRILVPSHLSPESDRWEDVDWPLAGFWYVHGLAERTFEAQHGPIHSYACRLKGWDPRLWSHAWANRIALFLRRWAARRSGSEEIPVFGPLPEPELILTHDVDAIEKAFPVRFKQAAFLAYNAFRNIGRNVRGNAVSRLLDAAKYLVRSGDYWCFDQIRGLEAIHGVTSWYFIYGGRGGMRRTPEEILFDPYYFVEGRRLAQQLALLRDSGNTIGLHQAFSSWHDPGRMRKEKQRLEGVLKETVSACRQHWLRFSWKQTWVAQEGAGLKLDCTLGFNDRPGFRNGAALRHTPLVPDLSSRLGIESLPMVIMDSHFHSYAKLCQLDIAPRLRQWVKEILAVRGQATAIWHTHVLSDDFGWYDSYKYLLEMLR